MSRQISRAVTGCLCAGVTVLALVACGSPGDQAMVAGPPKVDPFPAGTVMREIQDRGELSVGIKFDAPPFGFKVPTSEQVNGFDADMATLVADRLGVTPRFVETSSDNRIPFLQNGRVDIVFATMTITPERAEQVGFSDPYYVSDGRILRRAEDNDINGIGDLAGRKVCVTVGSTFSQVLKKVEPDAIPYGANGYAECAQLLKTRSVDAIFTEDVVLTGLVIQNPDEFKIVGDAVTEEPFGAAMSPDSKEFLQFVNATLDAAKTDGRWHESYEKWVGRYTGEDRTPPTADLNTVLSEK